MAALRRESGLRKHDRILHRRPCFFHLGTVISPSTENSCNNTVHTVDVWLTWNVHLHDCVAFVPVRPTGPRAIQISGRLLPIAQRISPINYKARIIGKKSNQSSPTKRALPNALNFTGICPGRRPRALIGMTALPEGVRPPRIACMILLTIGCYGGVTYNHNIYCPPNSVLYAVIDT